MRNPEIDAELNAIPSLVKGYSTIFTRRGYRYEGLQIVPAKANADHAVAVFTNDRIGVQIRAVYYPPFKDIRRNVVVSFTNRAGNTFYLSNYLKAHRRQDLEDWLRAEVNNPDFRVYCDDFFKKLDQLFDTIMKDIVEGRRWENIPFDFGDYK